MGAIGWIAINIVLVAVLATLIWGPAALFVMALTLAPIMLFIVIGLTTDFRFGRKR